MAINNKERLPVSRVKNISFSGCREGAALFVCLAQFSLLDH